MKIEKNPNFEIEKFTQPRLVFGEIGHEGEYVLSLGERNLDEDIYRIIAEEIHEIIGEDWEVLDRGTRIEIGHRKNFGKRDDNYIRQEVTNVLLRHNFNLVSDSVV